MKRRNVVRYVLAGIIALIAPACAASGEKAMNAEQQEAAMIAEKFIAERYADFDKRNKKLVVKDAGANWEVTYQLPDDMIGGAPVLVIDKKTRQVIRSYRTQ